MGRRPCCAKEGVNRGAWTAQEDRILTSYVNIHGEGKWRDLPQRAGLKRCGKSCRLRWLNYLRPDIKRGNISKEEEDLILKLHKLLGNRWSLIAGRLPGRTDNEIKNFWNTNLRKKVQHGQKNKCHNYAKQCNKLLNDDEELAMGNSSIASKPGPKTEEPHPVIRTKAVRCTNVVITQQQQQQQQADNLMVNKNGVPIWDHENESSRNDSSDFFMDFDIGDLFIWDVLNSEFHQEKEGNENENENENVVCGGFLVPAYGEALESNSIDHHQTILQDGKVTDPLLHPIEALELNTLASVFDLYEELIK